MSCRPDIASNRTSPIRSIPPQQSRYALPVRAWVNLAVFNLLGQQVAQLVSGEVDAGYHETTFDAGGLSSGVYLCRMQARDFVQSRKLLLQH